MPISERKGCSLIPCLNQPIAVVAMIPLLWSSPGQGYYANIAFNWQTMSLPTIPSLANTSLVVALLLLPLMAHSLGILSATFPKQYFMETAFEVITVNHTATHDLHGPTINKMQIRLSHTNSPLNLKPISHTSLVEIMVMRHFNMQHNYNSNWFSGNKHKGARSVCTAIQRSV